MVLNLLWFFLPLIFLVGIVTSYTDIKKGKIFNKHLLWALIALVFVYIIVFVSGWSFGGNYFLNLGINIFISFVVGFLFWHFGLWSAADSKLFVVYSALIPLIVYSKTYYFLFPSLTLLINSFVPFFIGFSLKSFFTISASQRKKIFSSIGLKNVFNLVAMIFVLMWIPLLIFNFFQIKLFFVISLLIMFVLVFLLKKLFGENLVFVMVILVAVRIIFDFSYVSSLAFLKQFLPLSIFLFIILLLVLFGAQSFTKKISIKEVRVGMILAGKIDDGKRKIDLEHPAEGLTDKDVKLLLTLHKKKKIGDDVKIYQTIPFAPFMFAGALLTIVLGGDFIISLVNFFI